MKDGDALNTATKAWTHQAKTDTRFTIDERAALVVIDAIFDADGDTTKEQDMVIAQCMRKYVLQNENY